jgi:DNA-binding transcriptional regulator YiaG
MFHYVSCGLRNVWLRNGYAEKETAYGKAVSVRDMTGLHRAIGLHLANRKAGRLTGAEFRFLRKELDVSQTRLAEIMGFNVQSVALWEKKGPPKWADRMLRAIYREHAEGNAAIVAMVDRLKALDADEPSRLEFEATRSGWRSRAA